MNPHCSQCFPQFSQCFPDVFKPEHLPWTFQEPSDSQISTLLALGGRPFSECIVQFRPVQVTYVVKLRLECHYGVRADDPTWYCCRGAWTWWPHQPENGEALFPSDWGATVHLTWALRNKQISTFPSPKDAIPPVLSTNGAYVGYHWSTLFVSPL